MLDLIRRKQKTTIVKVVFWAIIATFVGTIFLVWGKGRDRGEADTTVAVTVNDTRIGYNEFQTVYSSLYRLYQNIYRDQFNPEFEKQLRLPEQALKMLVDQALLQQEGARLGIRVSKEELVEAIAKDPTFQENGAFSKERYLEILRYQRLTPDTYEEMQKRQLAIQKLKERLQEGASVSEKEIEEEYRNQNEKVNLHFLKLVPALFESKVSITDEALADFFSEHREDFRIPETVALRYLQFEPARYEKEVAFEEGELEKYYRRNLDLFEIPEQVKASHILIKVSKDASDDTKQKKRTLAEKILEEARSGKDFAELARTHSDDPGSAAKGGDLGYFTRGTMVPSFEETAFNLKPGEISEIVESSFGFHIIKSEGYIEAGFKPLEDSLDEIKEGLRIEKSRKLAFEKAMDAYNMNRKTGNLDDAAKANDLGIKETGFFARNEVIDGIGDAPEITDAAFNLEENQLAKPIHLPQGIFLFTIKERKESRLPELEEVRADVEQAFRNEKGKELARQTAEDIMAQLKDDKNLKATAKKHDLKLEETGLFTRAYGSFIPKLGTADKLAKAAFTLTSENPVAEEIFEVDGKFVVAALKERQEADMAGLDEAKRDKLQNSLLARKKNELVNEKIKELREQAEITYAPSLEKSLREE